MAKWWELPEYEAAEKALRDASWACVCYVNNGSFEHAKTEAAKAMAAHLELARIESENG